jgi:hypothetical protein
MFINLNTGTFDSIGFKYDGDNCDIRGKFASYGNTYTVTIDNGYIDAQYIQLGSGGNMTWLSPTEINVSNTGGRVVVGPNEITWHNSDMTDGATFLTSKNYAPFIETKELTPSTTEAGNIDFNGSVNGASVAWVQEWVAANFVAKP